MWLPDGEKNDMFTCFDIIPACDRRTSCDNIIHAMHTHYAVGLKCAVNGSVISFRDITMERTSATNALWSFRWASYKCGLMKQSVNEDTGD